jgi:hypothetical protein
MTVTRHEVAQEIIGYLYHRITLAQLVDWAERVMIEGEFEEQNFEALRYVVSRLGLADVRAFGMTLEDCEDFLSRLGYQMIVTVSEAQVSSLPVLG